MRKLFDTVKVEAGEQEPRVIQTESHTTDYEPPKPEMERILCTIGFGNKKWEVFAQELQDAGIDLVIDVRHKESTSRSKCFMPQLDSQKFKTEGLARKLDEDCAIGYLWWWTLGKTQGTLSEYEEWLDSDHSAAMNVHTLAIYIEQRIHYNFKVALLSPEASPVKAHRRILAERCVKLFAKPVQVKIEHL